MRSQAWQARDGQQLLFRAARKQPGAAVASKACDTLNMPKEEHRRLTRRTRPAPPAVVVGEGDKVLVVGSEDRWLAQLYGRVDRFCTRIREILHLVEKTDPQGPDVVGEATQRSVELTVRIVGKVLHILALAVPAALVLVWQRIKMNLGSH
jgi:hypothetical protein